MAEENKYIESFLYETVLIETEDLLNISFIRSGKVAIEINDTSIASLLRLVYAAKMLRHHAEDPNIIKSLLIIEEAISLFNKSAGFYSKRIQEISIILQRVNNPERITTQEIEELIKTDAHLGKLVEQIRLDLQEILDNDNERFADALYAFGTVLSIAPHKNPQQPFYEAVSELASEEFKAKIRDMLVVKWRTKLKSFLLGVITLKEKPVFFALLLAGSSFLAGQMFNRSYLTVDYIGKTELTIEDVSTSLKDPDSFIHGGREFKRCEIVAGSKAGGIPPGTWYRHDYKVFSTSIQENKGMENFAIKLNGTAYKDAIFVDWGFESIKGMDPGNFPLTGLLTKEYGCYDSYMMNVVDLPNHRVVKFSVFAAEKTTPEIEINMDDPNVVYTLARSFSPTVWLIRFFVLDTHQLFTLLGIVIIGYLIIYISAKKS